MSKERVVKIRNSSNATNPVGATKTMVMNMIESEGENPDKVLSDSIIGIKLGVSAASVCSHRMSLGIPCASLRKWLYLGNEPIEEAEYTVNRKPDGVTKKKLQELIKNEKHDWPYPDPLLASMLDCSQTNVQRLRGELGIADFRERKASYPANPNKPKITTAKPIKAKPKKLAPPTERKTVSAPVKKGKMAVPNGTTRDKIKTLLETGLFTDKEIATLVGLSRKGFDYHKRYLQKAGK